MESRPDGSTPPPIELDDWEQLDDHSRWDRKKIVTQTQSTTRINQSITVTSAPQSNIPAPTPFLLGHNQSISSTYQSSVSLQNMGDSALFHNTPANLSTPSLFAPFSQLTSIQQPGLTFPSYQTSALPFPYMSPVPGQILTDPACLYNCGYPQISATFPFPFQSNTNSASSQSLLSYQSQLSSPVSSLPSAAATNNPLNAADLTQVCSELDIKLLTSGFSALSTRSNPSNLTIQASNNQPTAPIALLPTPSSSTSTIRSILNPTGNGLMQQPALPIQSLFAITELGVAQKSSQQAAKSSVNVPKPLIVPADDMATGIAATGEKDPQNARSAGGVPFIPRLERQRQMQAQQREANRRAATTQRPQSSSKGNTNNANASKSGAGGGGLRRPQPLLPTPPPGSSSTSTSSQSQSQSTSSAEHEASPGECSTSESFLPPGPIRILRRSDQSSSARSASTAGGAHSGAGAGATDDANGGAFKSLEQREAEYNQLKERIFSDCRCGECSWCACDRTSGDGSSMAEAPKEFEVQGGPPDRIIQSTAYASFPHVQPIVDEFRGKNETGIYSRILPRPKS